MPKETDVFNFHLNESLYFEKGQEVSEMVGISLEPDISIEPYEDYVSIRGVIALTGTYEKDPLIKQMEMEPLTFSDHSRRYVEKIESTADNVVAFSHHFPVEISVPSYRIDSIDDITVDVAEFDYDLPETNLLKLRSTITIYGIQSQATVREDIWQEKEIDQQVTEAPESDHFEFELTAAALNDEPEETRDAEPQDDEQTDETNETDRTDETNEIENETFEVSSEQDALTNDLETVEETEKPAVPEKQATREEPEKIEEQESLEIQEEQEKPAADEDPNRWKFQKTESFESFFKKKNDKEAQAPEAESVEPDAEVDTEISADDAITPEPVDEQKITAEAAETDDSDVVEVTEDVEIEETDEADNEGKGSYLSSLFRDEEALEADYYTQMRICIVQDQDTLETIAERYEVSKTKILTQNNLQDDVIQTGQLLSIPVQKES